jgi:hypothetical protein
LGASGGAVQAEFSLLIALETAWLQPSRLSSEKLVSQAFAFKYNLYRYVQVLRVGKGKTYLLDLETCDVYHDCRAGEWPAPYGGEAHVESS